MVGRVLAVPWWRAKCQDENAYVGRTYMRCARRGRPDLFINTDLKPWCPAISSSAKVTGALEYDLIGETGRMNTNAPNTLTVRAGAA